MIYKDDRAVAPISATVREQINGEYALDATFAEDVVAEEDILRASTPYGQQLFRVREVESRLDGTVSVYAPHIFYDLSDYFIEDAFPTAKTAQEALGIILNAATESHGFTATSDIATLNNARYVYKSVAEAIMAQEDNAVLNRWGGEIERDDYEIRLLQRKGADRGVSIRYRKNLTGLIARADLTDVKTRIYPTGLNENDTVLEITGKYIDSPLINDYAHPKIGRAHFSDAKVDPDGEYPTVAAVRAELVARANALYAAGADLPRLTLDVQFVDLSQTVEYAQYSQLEQVFLGDTVHVAYEPLGVDVSLRVVEYEWDACADRYLTLMVGDVAPKITDSVISTTIDISVLRDSMTDALKQGEKYNHVYINHDEGFVAQAEINGQEVKVMMNATDGMRVTVDGDPKFWVDADGNITASSLSNEPNSTRAVIGSLTPFIKGVSLVNASGEIVLWLVPYVGGGFMLQGKGKNRITCDWPTDFLLVDTDNQHRMLVHTDGFFQLWDHTGYERINANGSSNQVYLQAKNGASYNQIGVDGTGPYKVIAGVKTYL